ncbi:hypothetical protein NQ318_000919 [Aromia moschata]|uniref:DUF5641 domain-containing protein n=1 Tax=Aromia moschata TaxID=1265417 RepID=A0AAV8ZEH1_9CUCU|nr:hypothetical protein NQ318_000919 [Aromia moschata]
MENEQLRSLTAQRGQVKAQITRFTRFLDEFDKDNVLELELRLEKIDQLWKDFNSIQSKIECLDDSQTQRDYREHFENSYFTEVSRARKIINENMVSQNHTASSGSKSNNADVKLPIISIPHFYGDYREWPSFFDTFSALVDNNTNLSSVQKFHYLKNALKDNAKQVIESLEVSHENYKIAIDLLKTRFDNKKLIKKAHIASLFNISTLTKESYTELRKFLDEFNKHLRALKNMGELVDTWDCPLIHLITTKLDSTTKREWEEFSAKLDDPKIEDIKKFLADRCNVLETLEAANIKGIQKTYNKKASEQRTVAYTSNQVPQCPFCKGSHFIYACKAFLRLPVKSRYIEVRRMKLCTNCLRSGHFKADCKSSSCKRCQKRHSTFLHFDEENSAASAVAWTGDDNTHSGPVANNGEESSISTHSSNKEMQWLSNKREILDKSKIEQDISQYYFMDEPSVKTLGLLWNANSDSIQVITRNQPYERVTKRTILSNVSQIFDPLGLVGPTVIVAKIMLQRLWRLKLDWDEAVPEDLFTDWIRFRDQIKLLANLEIPRHVVCTNSIEIQIHGFSDASEAAYGACLFVRSVDTSGEISSCLLCAKSRVAPLKTLTLPRLELCGALLFGTTHGKVLAWIAAPPNKWKTFVCNRVAEIQRLTNINRWNHVRSHENPADLISRGLLPENLIQNKLWWSGPAWLLEDSNCWPISSNIDTVDIPESKSVVLTSITEFGNSIDDDIFTRFSSLTKTQRVIAYCLRFKHNLINKTDKLTGTLTNEELDPTLAAVRQKFWPLKARSTIKRILHKCVVCFKANPKTIFPQMGNLPEKKNPTRKDGVVRVVSVKTVSGVVKRPVTKICVLPVDSDKQMSKSDLHES